MTNEEMLDRAKEVMFNYVNNYDYSANIRIEAAKALSLIINAEEDNKPKYVATATTKYTKELPFIPQY